MNATGSVGHRDSDSTSCGLLAQVVNNEPDAWERLMRLYAPKVYGWALRFGVSEHDADDVVQEVMIRVSRNIHRFRRDSASSTFRGWLWTIMRRVLLDRWRSQMTRGVPAVGGTDFQILVSNLPEVDPDSSMPGYSVLLDPAFLRMLSEVQSEFAEHVWRSFELSLDAQCYESAEIAEQLGISKGAVRVNKCRVIRRLREVFGELADDYFGSAYSSKLHDGDSGRGDSSQN